ncbi:hypothetical protein AA0117_g1725 [Alternaria alternata]|uniref:Uncharacterized protein n=1 Tax=Alternaria alternata TaxID=5599 RepID=A0A4Q4NV93_ALTAL|nr:hypothetical protein AA0117_g1725 [Alternaria alternata]
MKFLATIILLTFLAATVIAGDCMKAPFQCKGMSLTCTTATSSPSSPLRLRRLSVQYLFSAPVASVNRGS